MVILIASDQPQARDALADHLVRDGRNEVLTAESIDDLEEAAGALESLDVLLFTHAFNEGRGREIRDRLRTVFPSLQTVLTSDEQGRVVSPQEVATWLQGQHSGTSADDAGATGPMVLGDYELREKRRTTPTTDTFRAVQRSVNREVVLERLKPECAGDSAAMKSFRGMVRARAGVNHPCIAAVYEAQETGGVLFHTRELVRGMNLEELAHSGTHLPPEACLHLLRAVSEAMSWLAERGIAREPLRRIHVHHGADGTPRIANLATATAQPLNEPAEIKGIAEIVMRIGDFKEAGHRELSHVLGLMRAAGPHALTSWKPVAREARTALRRFTEARTSSLEEGRDMVRARRRGLHARRIALLTVLIAVLVAGGWGGVQYWQRQRRAKPRDFSLMIHIPAGEFIFRDGQRTSLDEFWIDAHEVTLAQYAAFLEALSDGGEKHFNHPDQPAEKTTHEPADWSAIYAAAKRAGTWHGHPVTPNAPVFNVDWWDAWAYAKWSGRRLPSEREWEKAARGTSGNLYPWGAEPDAKRANTGVDYDESPSAGGHTDGATWWCDVDAMQGDISPFGVIGMAGNVAEWTDTWAPDPELPDEQVPVFCGGDFHQPGPVPCNKPWLAKKDARYAQPFLGFRTASSTPPP